MRFALPLVWLAGLLLSNPAFAADKKVVALGETNTRWARSPACPGNDPTLAERIGRSLASRLARSGAAQVVTRQVLPAGDGSAPLADLLLTVEFICGPAHAELNVGLVSVETTEIAWAKVFELASSAEAEPSLDRAEKLLTAFLLHGQRPDQVPLAISVKSPLARATLALTALRIAPGVALSPEAANRLRLLLKLRLADRAECTVGAQVPPGAGCDRACAADWALAQGLEGLLEFSVVRDGKRCALEAVLVTPASHEVRCSARVPSACDEKTLASRLDKLVLLLGH